jgi:CheY-like chemotaxis protein
MSKRKILLVDDDEAVLDFMQAKLGDRYVLVSTNSPANVLRLAREEFPDLIMCDIDMPEMDGGDVSAALFADAGTRHIPVLFLTALASPQELGGQRGQIGGRPAISKDAPLEQLLARIESLMRP